MRLDRWFRRRWPHLNHVQIHKLARTRPDPRRRRAGQGRDAAGRRRAGARAAAARRAAAASAATASPTATRAFVRGLVLYEDDEVLALNKPAGLAVQGGTKTTPPRRPAAERLGRGAGAAAAGAPARPRHLRRAGAGQVAGRGRQARRRLRPAAHPEDLLGDRRAARRKPARGRDRPAAGQDRASATARWSRRPIPKDPTAEPAETEFVTISRAGPDRAPGWRCARITGRTHQLRAHMLAIGHPILGDPKYHDDALDRAVRRAEAAAARAAHRAAASRAAASWCWKRR